MTATLSKINKTLAIRPFIFLLLIASCVYTITVYYELTNKEERVTQITKNHIKKKVESKLSRVIELLEDSLTGVEKRVDNIALNIANQSIELNDIGNVLCDSIDAKYYRAIAVNFSPSYNSVGNLETELNQYKVTNSNGEVLYSPFCDESLTPMPFPYDYLNEDSDKDLSWYDDTIKEPDWYGPYFGSANDRFVVSYRSPIGWNEKNKTNHGIVVADFSLENVRRQIQNISILESGYVILVNDQGRIISHPVEDYLSESIEDVEHLEFAKILALKNNKFYPTERLVHENSKVRERFIYKISLKTKPWHVLVMINKNETLVENVSSSQLGKHFLFDKTMTKLKTKFYVFLSLSLFLLICAIFWYLDERFWVASIVFSLLCLLNIVWLWYNQQQSNTVHYDDTIVILDKTDLEAAKSSLKTQNQSPNESADPIQIKTGFFIQSVKFSSSNDVYVTGYAWQHLPEKIKDACYQSPLQKSNTPESSHCLGFILPEAESVNMNIVYSDQTVTRWYFEASLRQEFNYLKYPFDEESVWIRARPKEFYLNNTTLVPDFDAYPEFEWNKNVGLESDLFIEGWNKGDTYYSLQLNQYNTNFGLCNYSKNCNRVLTNRPDLKFNITIRREFFGVFVAYMIPIIVISFLLFAVLMIKTSDGKLNDKLGFSPSTVLGYAASLFFVLVVSHMSLRETLNAKGIIYLEYFFFTLYVAIALVSVNAIIFTFRHYSGKYDCGHLKYLYWPGIMSSLLFATIWRFT